jgi:hypothetical protein
VFKDGLCARCNNEWLGPTEDSAKAILLPMAFQAKPTVLDAAQQALLSFWAVKTVFLLELAFQQKYPHRAVGGYVASAAEMRWLREEGTPPPESIVWLAWWDCERQVPVRYEPSGAHLPTSDGSEIAAHVATFSLGFVAFQVFSVDFAAARAHGADVWKWSWRPPRPMYDALPSIWPPKEVAHDVTWPPAAFRRADWRRLVTWDEARRPQG